jgi:hypothetical protein
MPPQNRFGLYNKERVAPAGKPSTGQNRRSALHSRGVGACAAAFRRCRFSATSGRLGRSAARMMSTRKRSTPPLRLVPDTSKAAKPRDCQPQSSWTGILRFTAMEGPHFLAYIEQMLAPSLKRATLYSWIMSALTRSMESKKRSKFLAHTAHSQMQPAGSVRRIACRAWAVTMTKSVLMSVSRA